MGTRKFLRVRSQTKSNNHLKMSNIFILSVVWMQLVKGKTSEESQKEQTKRDINFEQAYMDAKLNEVDSGTELDSQGEEEAGEAGEKDKAEEPTATKDEEEKKED